MFEKKLIKLVAISKNLFFKKWIHCTTTGLLTGYEVVRSTPSIVGNMFGFDVGKNL